jgi:hypothetical protein
VAAQVAAADDQIVVRVGKARTGNLFGQGLAPQR